jgi:hypothetical protein
VVVVVLGARVVVVVGRRVLATVGTADGLGAADTEGGVGGGAGLATGETAWPAAETGGVGAPVADCWAGLVTTGGFVGDGVDVVGDVREEPGVALAENGVAGECCETSAVMTTAVSEAITVNQMRTRDHIGVPPSVAGLPFLHGTRRPGEELGAGRSEGSAYRPTFVPIDLGAITETKNRVNRGEDEVGVQYFWTFHNRGHSHIQVDEQPGCQSAVGFLNPRSRCARAPPLARSV